MSTNASSLTDFHRFETDKLEPFDMEDPPIYVCRTIRLNEGISTKNYYCSLIHSILKILGYYVASSLQTLVLLDPDYYNADPKSIGELTAFILVLQLILNMVVNVAYGHLCDKLGRKTMIYYGAINYLISCIVITTQRSIFPGFIIGKLILTNAEAALDSVPLTADYIHNESKGKAVGLSGFVFSASSLVANLYLKSLFYEDLSLGKIYMITGAFIFTALIINSFGLKGGQYHLFNERKNSNIYVDLPFLQRVKEALQSFKSNGWLIIALILQVLGSSDFYIFFTFLLLFVKSMMPPDVPEMTFNILVNNLQTLVILPGIVTNFLYGYFLDKKNKPLETAIFALAGGALASLLTCFVTNPYDWKIFASALLLGLTIPGLFVISMYLTIKHIPSDKRGLMIGFKSMVGDIAYFVIASGGGLLYDYWRKDGPFIVCTVMLCVALISTLIVHKKMLA